MAATLRCDTIQNASSSTANLTLDASGNATVGNTLVMGSSFKRNKIINGDMRVDQRNAGAAISAATLANFGYTVDRFGFFASQSAKFSFQQNAGSVTPPTGFTNYAGLTVASAYSVTASDYFWYFTKIEGLNISDLAWGTANAKTVTLSFWVYSSLTGTFGGALQNNAQTWSYPFSYSISQANTWTQISVTIAGPNASQGTWLTTNGTGIILIFGLGAGSSQSTTANAWANGAYTQPTSTVSVVGTNGATFYITGVQLEVGSVATPYERQIYSEQLIECCRYYWRYTPTAVQSCVGTGVALVANDARSPLFFPVTMRTSATCAGASGTNYFTVEIPGGTRYNANSCSFTYANQQSVLVYGTFTGTTQGQPITLYFNNTSAWIEASAEL